jgi:thiamine pyrophosphokinase
VSRDAGLRGASRAQPALPDPGHTGGGNIFNQPTSSAIGGRFILHRIVIFANGELSDLKKARAILQRDDHIICADGGTRHALSLGHKPDLIIGDLDSAEKADLRKLRDDVSIELFPCDKNQTDLELAIQRAVELKPERIVIVAALGGRLDQTLANIALLSDSQLATFDIRLDDGMEEILFCRSRVEVQGRNGDIVSLIPWGVPVQRVQTQGLKWALNDETLHPDKTRGVSNEMLSDTASITIRSGLLLVVHKRKD